MAPLEAASIIVKYSYGLYSYDPYSYDIYRYGLVRMEPSEGSATTVHSRAAVGIGIKLEHSIGLGTLGSTDTRGPQRYRPRAACGCVGTCHGHVRASATSERSQARPVNGRSKRDQ